MAAQFNSLFIIVTFCLLSACTGLANAQEESLTAHQISLITFTKSKTELENAIQRCEKNRSIVDKALLEKLNLTLDELKTVLFTLNQRATSTCENGLREKLFYSAATHRQISNQYNKSPDDAANYTEELFLAAEKRKVDFEAKYLKLPKKTRTTLEAIDELKIPFLIFETLEQF